MSRVPPLLATHDLTRVYLLASEEIRALDGVTMEVEEGQFLAVVGRSGSGKTTLLNLMAGLDKPSSGTVFLQGRDLAQMNEAELIKVRRHRIGFVFQSFGLLPLLSALENVELPLRIAGAPAGSREKRAREALEMVGLEKRMRHRPYELSGGEQQRVAIARAFVINPALILADEPTGELDSANSAAIFSLFKEMTRNEGISVITATHDTALVALADEVKELRDGAIVNSH